MDIRESERVRLAEMFNRHARERRAAKRDEWLAVGLIVFTVLALVLKIALIAAAALGLA